ncbi:neuronal acetylcholine receptor subunit beta-4-like [Glandiceps talaboti]
MESWNSSQLSAFYKAVIIFSACCSAQLDDRQPAEDKLFSDLFSEGRYNKLSRPAINYTQTIHFTMGLHITYLLNMNEKIQIMTTAVRIDQSWNDYRLSWSPDHYGGITQIHLPVDMIWYPRLSLENSAEGNFELQDHQHMLVYHSGLIQWIPKAIVRTTCQIDVRFFPFDEQKCLIIFSLRDYDRRHVFLHSMYRYIQIGTYWHANWINDEWTMISSEVEEINEDAYIYILHTLVLRRKPLFFIINLIAPSVLLSVLTILVFALPPDSGEKVTLSISVLLAMMIFKLMVADIVPPTSSDIALIDQCLLFNATLVVMSTFFTVLVLNIHHRLAVTHEMPAWVRKFFIEFLPRFICINKPRTKTMRRSASEISSFSKLFQQARRTAMREKSTKEDGQDGEMINMNSAGNFASLRKEMMKMAESSNFISEHLKKEDADNKLTEEWRYVAVVLDRMLLWIYLVGYCAATCAIILNAPLARGLGSESQQPDQDMEYDSY